MNVDTDRVHSAPWPGVMRVISFHHGVLVDQAILHDEIGPLLFMNQLDVIQRVADPKQQVPRRPGVNQMSR
jgi:hypothetical protein